MGSKIEAAEISKNAQIETWILNGLEDNFITNAFENKVPFTKIK
jgi:glutamate 5-kinase